MISAKLSRRIAKARQSEVFLRDTPFDTYLLVLNTLSKSNAQTLDDLPANIRLLVKRAEDSTLTAAGDFNEAEHPRDNKGKFAEKVDSGAGMTRVTALKNAYDSGYKVDDKLSAGGSGAEIDLLTLSDGTQVVRKTHKQNETRREYLAGRVFDALNDSDDGVTTAQVDDNTIITTYVRGATGAAALEKLEQSRGKLDYDQLEKLTEQEHRRQATLRGGKEIAMLDALTENHDRHSLNWIMPKDDASRVDPIDQGNAKFESTYVWNMQGGRDEALPTSVFGDYWFGFDPYGNTAIDEIKPRYTRADIAEYRTRIAQLRDEFQSDDEKQWFEFMNRRLGQIEEMITA